MQDGATARYSKSVRNCLNGYYPGRWTGPESQIAWCARSPDLNPIIFGMGNIKSFIYADFINNPEELQILSNHFGT